MSEAAEKRIAELESHVAGLERMMFFILDTVGEPVTIPNEKIEGGLTGDKAIDISQTDDSWVFTVLDVPSEVE